MKKMICLLAILCTFQLVQAQLQTGEDVAVTSTEAGKVRGYHSAARLIQARPDRLRHVGRLHEEKARRGRDQI